MDEINLIDPDPLSVIMLALGAAGSIASLVGLVQDRMAPRRDERRANEFALRDAIAGAETALNELRGQVRALEILLDVGASTRAAFDPSMAMVGFGRISPQFTRDGYERWREIHEGIILSASRIGRYIGDVMRLFATGDLRLPRDTAMRLQAVVERLNSVLRRMAQIHFADLFAELETIIGESADVLRMLRQDLHSIVGS